ncbi:MAG: DUF5668 domain-containing protein [bacterium]
MANNPIAQPKAGFQDMRKKKTKKDPTSTKEKNTDCCNNGSPVWAIFLVSLGTMFLLNNFGFVPWSIWGDLWRFWPLFLILGGVRIIMGRSIISNIVLALLGIILFGFVFVYSAFSTSSRFNNWLEDRCPQMHERFQDFTSFSDSNTETKNVSVKEDSYSDVKSRIVDLNIGARSVTVEDSEETSYMSMETNFIQGRSEPSIEEDYKKGVLTLSVDSENTSWGWNMLKNPYMDIAIGNPEIPTSLKTILGAGTATYHFEKLILSELDLQVGAGTMSIDLMKENVQQLDKFLVDVGAGTLNMNLPEDKEIGWKIIYDIGLGTLNIDGNNYRGDGSYTTDNYSIAKTQIDVTVNSGVGTVNIDIE